jgi:hypothetical protein
MHHCMSQEDKLKGGMVNKYLSDLVLLGFSDERVKESLEWVEQQRKETGVGKLLAADKPWPAWGVWQCLLHGVREGTLHVVLLARVLAFAMHVPALPIHLVARVARDNPCRCHEARGTSAVSGQAAGVV